MNFNTREDMEFAFNSKGENASATTNTTAIVQSKTYNHLENRSSRYHSLINDNGKKKLDNPSYTKQHEGERQESIHDKNQNHNDIHNITTTGSNKKASDDNADEPENTDVARLNQKLHESHSNKKKGPNTYNSLLEVGAGFSEQKRLIDDLIAQTKEDIQRQRNVIENKLQKKRKYKEICDIIYGTVSQNNKDSLNMRKLLQLHDDDNNGDNQTNTTSEKKENVGSDNAESKEHVHNSKSKTEQIDVSNDLEKKKSIQQPCSKEHTEDIASSP